MEQKMQLRHCSKCVNACPLDKPMCKTGKALAEEGGLYEPVPEEPKVSLWKKLFGKKDF